MKNSTSETNKFAAYSSIKKRLRPLLLLIPINAHHSVSQRKKERLPETDPSNQFSTQYRNLYYYRYQIGRYFYV